MIPSQVFSELRFSNVLDPATKELRRTETEIAFQDTQFTLVNDVHDRSEARVMTIDRRLDL